MILTFVGGVAGIVVGAAIVTVVLYMRTDKQHKAPVRNRMQCFTRQRRCTRCGAEQTEIDES